MTNDYTTDDAAADRPGDWASTFGETHDPAHYQDPAIAGPGTRRKRSADRIQAEADRKALARERERLADVAALREDMAEAEADRRARGSDIPTATRLAAQATRADRVQRVRARDDDGPTDVKKLLSDDKRRTLLRGRGSGR